MCGLVGILSSSLVIGDSDLALFCNLLLVDQIRGAHATGVAKIRTKENTVAIHKQATDAVKFLASEETGEFLTKDRGTLYIGHNRYATMGDKSNDDNAHPFQHKHITLVHNGGVDSHALHLLEGNDDKEVEVDSHMVCMTLAEFGVKELVEKKLSGAYTLIWWDSEERSLNFIRNNRRPLWIATLVSGSIVWASEKGMLDVFCDRTGAGKASSYRAAPISLTANTHYKFLFNQHGYKMGTGPTLTKMEELDIPTPKSSSYWENMLNDWYGENRGARVNVRVNQKRGDADGNVSDFRAAATARSNKTLEEFGSTLKVGAVVSAVVSEKTTYTSNPEWCTITALELNTKAPLRAYALSTKQLQGVTHVRGVVKSAYPQTSSDGTRTVYIEIGDVGLSIHDAKYEATKKSAQLFDTMSVMPSATSVSNKGSQRRELRQKLYGHLKPIRYPLKVQGHTFPNSEEFMDFVCGEGCMTCGEIPGPYDRRNNSMRVIQGARFAGLLRDCLFNCGSCEEEANE
jgi:hypothetical protein